MEKIVKYIANDGTEFDDEYDCCLYELKIGRETINIICLDVDGNVMSDPTYDEKWFNNVSMVAVNDEEAAEFLLEIGTFFGFPVPASRGIWYYDADNHYWKKALKKVEECRDFLNNYFTIELATVKGEI